MRTSRVVFTGIAVAAAAAAGTSAFTASNTVPNSVAGYGQGTISGATVTNIQYTPLSTDNTYLASVVFTTSTNVTTETSTMTLKLGATPLSGSPYSCTYSAYSAGTMTITCLTPNNPAFTAFDTVGLTVVQ